MKKGWVRPEKGKVNYQDLNEEVRLSYSKNGVYR